MKNLSKSILAILSFCLVLAACTSKSDRTTDSQDTIKVEEPAATDATAGDSTTTEADSTSAPADSTVAE